MGRRLRSALFIDFENVTFKVDPATVSAWLAWLEDGAFDETARKRRLSTKRIYWNASHDVHRPHFEKAGFEVIRCDKYAALKNGADIRMTLDIVEAVFTDARVEEFILITRDTDFIPVLERLKEKGKRTAILADEHRPVVYTSLSKSADIVIPFRQLKDAFVYQRPQRSLLGRLGLRLPSRAAQTATPQKHTPNGHGRASGTAGVTGKSPATGVMADEMIDTAGCRIVALTSATPRMAVARKLIEAELAKIEGFYRDGPDAYFGTGSYRELMVAIGRRHPPLKVHLHRGGGVSIIFMPANENQIVRDAEPNAAGQDGP
ncbi:MAG: NYN domain-containing protein [Hyphomicrobiaceae bacterium]